MAKKVGTLIKEARTDAGMSQEQLARKIKGLSAAELGKAERGETELTQALLKETAKKTAAAKKTETAKKAASPKKTSTAKKTGTELTAAEKKLLEAYREASADAKKNALKLLKGEDLELAEIMKLLKLDSFDYVLDALRRLLRRRAADPGQKGEAT